MHKPLCYMLHVHQVMPDMYYLDTFPKRVELDELINCNFNVATFFVTASVLKMRWKCI